MEQEWISLNEFKRRNNVGYETVLKMMHEGQIEGKKIGGRYKIRVGGDTVSRALYEEEHSKRIKAETTIELLQNILLERR